jgi:hypothetical protein
MTTQLQTAPRRLFGLIKRFPATIAVMAVILVVGLLTSASTRAEHRALVDRVGLDLNKVLDGRLWTLPASTVIQSNPGIGIRLALLVLVSLAAIEYAAGSLRAILTFFLSDWISAPLTVLVAWPLAHSGFDRAYNVLNRPDTGSSAAALGALAASLVFLTSRWRIAAFGALFAALIYLLPTAGLSANIAHLLGAVVGTGLGLLWLHLDTGWKAPKFSTTFPKHAPPDLNLVSPRAADDD